MLLLVTFEPVEQIAAEPATLKVLAETLRRHATPAPEPAFAGHLAPFAGLPLVADPNLPGGFIYLRPTPHRTLITAPWTPDQVHVLNLWQRSGGSHPLTCGADHTQDRPTLIATPVGWTCPDDDCTYTQDWALDFMTRPLTSTGESLPHPKDPT